MSTQTLIEHGPFIAGTAEPLSGEHGRSPTPAPASSSGASPSATARGRRPRRARRARRVQRDWARLGYADRGKIIHACAEAFEAHVDELTPILVAEQGKTIREAKIELHKAADTLEHYAGLSRQVRGISVHNVDPGVDGARAAPPARRRRRDRAVELPDDAAVQQARPGVPGRQHGRGQARRHDAADDAAPGRDLPRGRAARRRVQRPPGHGRASSATRWCATRSCARSPSRARRRSASRSPRSPRPGSKRVTLELGGSDPMIICDDADLKAAASAAAMGRFYNCGQACLAIKRLYVFESVADEIIEAVAAKAERLRVGIGSDPDSQLGPLHTEGQREELERQIAESGGEIVAGGGRPEGLEAGWFHEPTVVVEPRPRLADGARGGLRPGAADLARERHGRGDRAGQRLAVRPRLERVDARPRPRRARRGRARLRLHVDQLAHQGLRRAALRRAEGVRLRQGARLRGARLLHRPEVGRGQAR